MKNNVPKPKLGRKRKLSDKDITDIKKSITDRDDELDSYSVDSLNEKLANSAGQFIKRLSDQAAKQAKLSRQQAAVIKATKGRPPIMVPYEEHHLGQECWSPGCRRR